MKVLKLEEEEILAEQRKRASSDTQSLIKIIDRLRDAPDPSDFSDPNDFIAACLDGDVK